jgi:hypothetical protein
MDISELFPAGPIIDERHQIGRGPSIDALTDRLRAGDVVRVFDRRRWGKSSVARAALSRLEAADLVAVRLPLDEYPTASAAAAVLAAAFRTPGERAASEAQSLGSRLGGALSRAGQTVGSEEASAIGGLLEGLKPEDVTLQRVLGAIPAELAKTGRRGAIAIDEAHEDWRHGLRSRFDQAEVPIDDEALELLLEESRCHPYCTMLLAKHAAELAQSFGTVTTSVIRLALPTVQKHEAWRLR